MTVLVTGATGRAGRHVARILQAGGHPVRAAVNEPAAPAPGTNRWRSPSPSRAPGTRRSPAWTGCSSCGPHSSATSSGTCFPPWNARGSSAYAGWSCSRCRAPKRTRWSRTTLWRSGCARRAWSGPSSGPRSSCRTLSTTHAADIRDRDEILLPAGHGRTSFVDVRDVAAVAALALTEEGHVGRAYTPTGSRALDYGEAAHLLTAELGRPIRYVPVGPVRYWRSARGQGMPAGMTLVTLALYTTCRLGLAAGVTTDVRDLLGRPPIGFAQFVHDERAAWLRVPGSGPDRPATAADVSR